VVNTGGRAGPAVARNTAIAAARAPLIAPLDGDDLFYPDWLRRAYEAYLEHPENIVYSDCDTEVSLGKRERYRSGNFTAQHIMREAIYQVSILYPKQWWEAVGGYPTDQPYQMWEDWLFGVKLHLLGVGASYLEGVPWGVYRKWTAGDVGSKNAIDNAEFGSPAHKAKYRELLEWIGRKEQEMACVDCSKKAKGTVVVQGRRVKVPTGPDRTFVYVGPQQGSFTVNSHPSVSNRKYRIEKGVPFTAPAGDAELRFSRLKDFEELVREEGEMLTDIPQFPMRPPEIAAPVPHPAPQTDTAEMPPPRRVDDIARLGLDEKIVEVLRSGNFYRVSDIVFDIRAGDGAGLLAIKGIGPRRYEAIVEAVKAMEAA
jgi:hypothetical protein